MKKIISILATVVLLFTLVLPMTVSAASASATLTGPNVIRVGDTITLEFKVNGSNILGASGTLSYDSNQVTLVSTTQKIASPWAVEFNGNNFVAYDNNLTNPINSNKTLFTVTFKVKSVAVGTNITISYNDVTTTNGNADTNIGKVTYSATVAAPKSTNNNLATLNVSNATISPAFSANTTSYTATVPFSVSKLTISATAEDSKATVKVNSPNLTPGGKTNVTVTVTAENGSTKTYTIAVTREQDPNYVANSNNNLSNITVDGFLLSPVFDKTNTNYVIWLPYETTSVNVSGTAEDNKASVEVVGGDNLVAGADNIIKVICTAEDGSAKEYIVVAKRAAAHGSEDNSQVTPPASSDVTPPESSDVTSSEPESSIAPNSSDVAPTTAGFDWYWLAIVGGAAFVFGIIIGSLCKKKK